MVLPRTGSLRYTKWSVKFDPATVSTRFTQVRDLALQLGQEGLTKYAALDDIIAPILDKYGISGNQRIPYRNFARKILRESDRFTGEALVKAVNAAKQYFVLKYGADPAVLDELAQAVVGVTPTY